LSGTLDSLEEKALNFLRQVSNPLVRIDVLHAHLTEGKQAATIALDDLKSFLAGHAQVRVIESLPEEAIGERTVLSGAGSALSHYVVLVDRVPADHQLDAMMLQQLDSMREALAVAEAQANDDDDALIVKISDSLKQIDALKQKLLTPPDSSAS